MDSDPTSPERGYENGGESDDDRREATPATGEDVEALRREAREYRGAFGQLAALQLERTGSDLAAAFRGQTGGLVAFPDGTVGDLRDALDPAELVVDEIAATHPDVDEGPAPLVEVGGDLDVKDDSPDEESAGSVS